MNQTPLLMSVSRQCLLAQKVRQKLIRCASPGRDTDIDLRLLVGHANLLDRLAREAADAAAAAVPYDTTSQSTQTQRHVPKSSQNVFELENSDSESDSDGESDADADEFWSSSDSDDDADSDDFYSGSDGDSDLDAEEEADAEWDTQLGIAKYDAAGPYCLYKPVSRYITTTTVVLSEGEDEDDEESVCHDHTALQRFPAVEPALIKA
ncbi:LAQU0S19e01376g1_1 [Lachancea quebecensis]|uniref:LAQU0S19e01376g1_1 n=1 Tax=Lachancea quebecensis TaxID=1654605 RepID=A0A0P1KX34_9SACH|nr:LAQU0S19e01376g1_1 [Lachancea quebecensis]